MVTKEIRQQQIVNNIVKVSSRNLAVCILFYEKLEQTIECIKSFLLSGVNIYILNNGSSPSARQALGQFCDNYKRIKIFDSNINLGVGVGRNYLISHTMEEWLLFVDNDITMKTSDWLQRFAHHVSQCSDIEVFIPILFNVQENYYSSYPPFKIVGNNVIRDKKIVNDLTNSFPGGASFVNRKLFEQLGLYDDKMFVGLEDYEFCIRGICLGKPAKACLIHDIELVHDHRHTKKTEDRKALLTRYDVNLFEESYNRIVEKYNLILEGDWVNWSADIIERILKKDNYSTKKDWKLGIFNQPKRTGWKSIKKVVSFILPRRAKEILRKMLHLNIPLPSSCSLFMTDRCNFKCRGCYRSVIGVMESKEMTVTTVRKLLSLYPSLNSFTVAGLGEPTLCPNFGDIVNFLRKNKKHVGVITNGTNLNKLLGLTYKPSYISISLKGYDNKSYLAYTGVAAYDRVIETFFSVKAKFKNVGFSYMLNKTNYKDLEKLLPLCDNLKPDFLHLTNYLVYDPSVPEEVQKIITVKDSEIIDYISKICVGRDYIRLKPVYIDFDNPKYNCRSYDYKINLGGDGNIGGCQRQIPPNISFGNVFIDNDPYNSLKMRNLRNLARNKSYPHKECRFCFGNWG